MEKQYSISDLAKEFDVSTRTLRFYEEKGILKPERHKSTRVYSASDRVTLKLLLRGKRLGFSIQECVDLISMYDPESGSAAQLQSLLEKIQEKQKLLEQQQADLKLMLIDLKAAETKCIESLNK
ncbi:MAG: MerR family transcriptional regulator [Arenicella sp.]